jgi:hypothetical protein
MGMIRRYSRNTLFKQLGLAAVVIVVLIGGGFAVTPSYGQEAETSTSTVRVPFTQEPFHPCIGEFVELSGDALFVVHTTVNPDGTKSLEVRHMSTEGLKGTTESGDPVVFSQVDHVVESERGSGGVFHTTVQIRLAVNGQPNAMLTVTTNTIINQDGTTKHDVSHVNIRCVGQG